MRSKEPAFWTPILYDVAHAFGSLDDSKARVDRVLELMRRFVPYERCALLELRPVFDRPITIPADLAADEHQALSRRAGQMLALLAEHPLEDSSSMASDGSGRTHLAVPLIVLGETTGIILVERSQPPYEDAHLAFLSVIAAQTGSYLAAVRAERELRASERQRAELLAEREADIEFLELFLGMLGHDLRNPLGAIRMSAEMLGSGDLDLIDTFTARILASTERMERMVEQLLDLTRIRLAGGILVEPAPVDLRELCQRSIDELATATPDASFRLEVTGDVVGHWDGDRLLQVVSNLLANAVQHATDRRDISIGLAADGDDVVLTTHNAGAIEPELLPVLFDPFRGSRAGNGPRRGLGLGLFITKNIVEAHGGTIEVSSSDAQGTTFAVRLPRRAARDRERPAPAAPAQG